ncbi:DNA-binding response regulator [Hydrogenophaga crassostreae]|uniref:DNA-binding response regulator n=1 Tax=Hydrogenophaga crassostreae TaxID=1763535 RepID=A0A163CNC1_9BURK|nr:LytTR family DNA-binding domain-containing protein [Hydrogenophaga crassostreae]AOW15760.1 DNA-binding response regulator [Hydrogenophaga crassostreae]OAD43802.1 DNA-binding response regulator [Hydrogenophaga crassostreae]
MPRHPTALIAEDEPLLAAALQAELKKVWPELDVIAVVGNGQAAVEKALALTPDVVFLDIRMPGMTGLEAAAELADEWPAEDGPNPPPFPALVFVTAYDEYALQAFEAQAMDYVLKPVQASRLARTAQRVQSVLAQRATPATPTSEAAMDATLAQLRALLGGPEPTSSALPERLKVIQASVGHAIHMVPVNDVVLFEASDKYVRVLTAVHEYLIRTPLKDLLPQLDPSEFWQVHRGTVVRAAAIDSVQRDEAGRTSLMLRERDGQRIAVSRVYAARFRAM